jgi:peptide/nickel transport system substrate-binding protein
MRKPLFVAKITSFALLVTLTLAACAGPTTRGPGGGAGDQPSTRTGGTKTITLGFTAGVQSMSIMGATTTAGGWQSLNETHSNGLVTSDVNTRRPVPRLASRLPSLDDESIALLPDGRMRVTYPLRTDVTWQDGARFTAQDLVFSYKVNSDPGLPSSQRDVINQVDSVEAPDDATFVLFFKVPYYIAGTMGVRPFWPHPQHLLGAAYDRYQESRNADDFINHAYWTHEYVHLGPFRLTEFDPGEGITLGAYDGYFLGRPKVDIVKLRSFSDQNTLFSNLLSHTVDAFPDIALSAELGYQLKDRWESSGQGTVHAKQGITWFLAPQWRPAFQTEPANLDPRVRAALYHALDRVALSDALQGGHPELAAWSMLPPGDQHYEATRDALRPYAFDQDRSRAMLRDLGWTPGGDGILRHAFDGRRFHNQIWTTPGRDREVAAFAAYWRQIGLEVDEFNVPAAQVRNLEYRATYPSWESSAQGSSDAILGRMDPPPSSAATRWVGERGGFEDPRAWDLVARYRASLSERDQSQAMKAISDYVASELPFLILYYVPDHVGVRKGVKAFEDHEGGAEGARPFGTYTRNAHLWEVQ